ncbi:hypothetical protein [Microbacterium sp. A1-JK]|uniref:hypothetical protein n=1 Tax=Microbacterium sp. A1-JK TaxID=3177516 RepID=UPI003889355B
MTTRYAIADHEVLCIVPDNATEEEWHEGRSEGVTASEIHRIATGGIGTLDKILSDKLNGSTFKGNLHTQRGHDNEADLISAAERAEAGVSFITRSTALFGNLKNPLHRATPDGIGVHLELGVFGAEAKHHAEKKTGPIPADHFDQMQWGMHVLGVNWWLYVRGAEGSVDVETIWVARDDARIEQLIRQADRFIAWREAGAPKIDDLPEEIDDALADYYAAQQAESAARKAKEAAGARIKGWAADQTAELGDPLRRGGSRAQVYFEPKPDVEVLDETAWASAEPESYAAWLALSSRVAEAASAARVLYHRNKPVAPTFRVSSNGENS